MTPTAALTSPARAERAVAWVGQVLAWVTIILVAGVLLAAVVVPRLSGATPYAVLTGSMRPSLPEGTLVVVRPTRPESIGIGSVITYQLESGRPVVVTHRVVAQAVAGDGSRLFRTRGDANDVADEKWVRPVQIKGQVWYAVPQIGRVNTVLSGHQHQVLVQAAAAGLLGYAAFMFTGSLRRRRTSGREVPV